MDKQEDTVIYDDPYKVPVHVDGNLMGYYQFDKEYFNKKENDSNGKEEKVYKL